MTHITFATAKLLHEFLGESAPEPMIDDWYALEPLDQREPCRKYMLHDLLSKPFYEAMAGKYFPRGFALRVQRVDHIYKTICQSYWSCSLPAVEAALVEMMEGK
jgi:hypothetical protein